MGDRDIRCARLPRLSILSTSVSREEAKIEPTAAAKTDRRALLA
jgi:hypothetical protein